MKILVVEPQCKPKIQKIDGRLQTMQKIVGGTIQALYPFEEPVALVANDEGKLLGLPMNRALRDEQGNVYEIICGTFFLCGLSDDSFSSLTEEQVYHFRQVFDTPELFMKVAGGLMILPLDE